MGEMVYLLLLEVTNGGDDLATTSRGDKWGRWSIYYF